MGKFLSFVVAVLVGLGAYWWFSNEKPSNEKRNYKPVASVIVDFDEIYEAYEANELRAANEYKNNRYRINGKVNGMNTGGLFNLTGGATLTMEANVGGTVVFFYAEFEKDQEEALSEVDVGDSITFEGECLSAGSWVECELIRVW